MKIASPDYAEHWGLRRGHGLAGPSRRRRAARALTVMCLGCAAVIGLGSPAQATVTRTGTLQATVFDDFDDGESATRYTLRSGKRKTVVRPTKLEAEPGDQIVVTGKLDDGRVVGRVEAAGGAGPQAAVEDGRAQAVVPPRKVAVLLTKFPNDPDMPWQPGLTQSKVFTGSNSVDAFYREESYGDISLTGKLDPEGDVFGWFTLGNPGPDCQFTTWQQEADQAASEDGIDLSGYEHIVYAFPHRSSCQWAGIAGVNGNRSSLNGNVSAAVIAHEIGHNLGLYHSGSWRCTSGGVNVPISDNCTTQEYGDPFDTMGNIAYRHNNGWHLAKVGILAPENVQTVSASGTYTLRSALNPTAEPTVLRVPRTRRPDKSISSWYYLEIREQGGIFENVTDFSTSGVSIRATAEHSSAETLLLDANPATSGFFNAPLAVGQTFDGGPVQIRTVAAGGGNAIVEVEVDAEPPSPPSDLQASVDADGLRLSWVGTDNVGVERYLVFRDGEQMGSVQAPSFREFRPPAGDHKYTVIAEDESLNQSDPSEPLTVTVPVVSGPTCAGGECRLAYRYSGAPATWTVPAGVDGAFLVVEGARGGGVDSGQVGGGSGARILARIEPLTTGQSLGISVGGQGKYHYEGGAGGFNGGGAGGIGGGGGGYTKVELDSMLEVLAAGGGGRGVAAGLLLNPAGGSGSSQGGSGGNGFPFSTQGATLGGGKGGAGGGGDAGGAGGAGGQVTGTSACPAGTQAGLPGADGSSLLGGGGVASAGGGGGGGNFGGGQGGGGATDGCEAPLPRSGGGGGGSSLVASGRLVGFDSASGDDGWLSIEYDNPVVAVAHSYTTAPDQQLVVPAVSGVLSGASGPGEDALAASMVTPPDDGTLTLEGDGSFTYTPDSGYFGSDSFVYEADDPSSDHYATAEVTLAVAEPPGAAISTPADEATYMQGQTVSASFACTEGPGGPGISSCTGTVANGQPIDTSATGEHTFTVIATSEDGLVGEASTTYEVEAAPPEPPSPTPPGPEPSPSPTPPSPRPEPTPPTPQPLDISIRGGLVPVVHRQARVRLDCDGTAAPTCRGVLLLRGAAGNREGPGEPIVLGRTRYAIPAGASRIVSVRLRGAAFTMLSRTRRKALRAEAIATLGDRRSARRELLLQRKSHRILVRYLRSGGLGGDSVHLVVAANGRARLSTRSSTTRTELNRKMRARLIRALRRAQFVSLKPSYKPANPTADAFIHVVTHDGHTVRAVDTAGPRRLQAMINTLSQVVHKLGRARSAGLQGPRGPTSQPLPGTDRTP